MKHVLQLAEINDGEWRFLFYEGKLLSYAAADDDEAIYMSTIDMLPFVEVETYQIPKFNVDKEMVKPAAEFEALVYGMLQEAIKAQ